MVYVSPTFLGFLIISVLNKVVSLERYALPGVDVRCHPWHEAHVDCSIRPQAEAHTLKESSHEKQAMEDSRRHRRLLQREGDRDEKRVVQMLLTSHVADLAYACDQSCDWILKEIIRVQMRSRRARQLEVLWKRGAARRGLQHPQYLLRHDANDHNNTACEDGRA